MGRRKVRGLSRRCEPRAGSRPLAPDRVRHYKAVGFASLRPVLAHYAERLKMAFPLNDLRVTSRRSSNGGYAVYPRLIRNRSFVPKVDIAIQYFETMLGRERSEFDSEVLTHFFGDHKVARCMVSCLGSSYQFRPPEIAEVVSGLALKRLLRSKLESPRALRRGSLTRSTSLLMGFLLAESVPRRWPGSSPSLRYAEDNWSSCYF